MRGRGVETPTDHPSGCERSLTALGPAGGAGEGDHGGGRGEQLHPGGEVRLTDGREACGGGGSGRAVNPSRREYAAKI